jgi:sphingomyelin phosphodiesterase acid-like 3
MEFLNQQLQDAFPAANIYMTIGNNDSYQNDYINYPKGPFYHDMAELWSGLLHDPTSKNSFNHEFPEGGYYALDIAAQPNIRLIVLNSVLFSTKIQGPGVTKAAEDELAWLEGEFAHLRKSQKILIVMHIPIGTDVFTSLKFHPFVATELWQTQFSQEFLKILRDHPNQIMGILAAHFHKDWFAVLNPDILSAHPIPISGVPSVSPIFGNNPTYRVYQVSADLQQLADFTTYYLPLAKPLQWLTEYHFNAVYQPLCYHCQITAGMERLKRQGLLAQYYLAYYDTQIASAPTRLYWQPFYWCTVHHVTKEDYLNCINTNFTSKFGNIPA